MQSSDQKKLSECEVAQLETLIRRMDDCQHDGLWLWLNAGLHQRGFLQDRSLWDALTKEPPEVIERKEKIKKAAAEIDPETCEIFGTYTELGNPYGDHPVPPRWRCMGKSCFVRNKGGDTWVCDDDLPKDKLDALWKRIDDGCYDVGDDIPF